MAYFKFAAAIKNGKSIDVYNNGDMSRDFTYIDDIVDGIISAVGVPPSADEGVPHRVFNLGNSHPEQLMEMIRIIESLLGMVADKRYLPMQPGDVERTYADVADAKSVLGYLPKTGLEEGLKKFVGWYQSYYQ